MPVSMDVLDFRTGYCRDAFKNPESLLDDANWALKGIEYDTMVCTGASGAALVPWLARALDKNFLIVRKDSENSHSGGLLNGFLGRRWIFVDDLIDSGETLLRVLSAIDDELRYRTRFTSEFVGSYLYAGLYSQGPTFEYPYDGPSPTFYAWRKHTAMRNSEVVRG